MFRCKYPRWVVKARRRLQRFYELEEKFSNWIKSNKFFGFLRRWGKLIIGVQFGLLFLSRNNAVRNRELADLERDHFKRANEILVNERVYRNRYFESVEVSRWKKIMLLDNDGIPTFRMVEVSESYEGKFLRPFDISLSDYIGFTDFEVWPMELAQEYYDEDKYVSDTGNPVYTIGTDPRGGELLIIKERILDGGRVYVVGRAIEKKSAKSWFEY